MSNVCTETPVVYVAPSGKAIAYLSDTPVSDGQLAYSPNGETFYALASSGFSGSRVKHEISFKDPHQDIDGKLRLEDEKVEYNGEIYQMSERQLDTSSIIPLPSTRRIEYLCQDENKTFVYVSADKYNYSYESFRLFIGDGATMREVQVDSVTRYRDGGTTYIETADGVFFSPSPFNAQRDPDLVPKWCNNELVALDAKAYNIVENDDSVIITKK